MDLILIASFSEILIGLVSIIILTLLIRKLDGKLKNITIISIFAIILFVIKESIKIHSFVISTSYNIEPLRSILNGIIILIVLIAVINMKQMINGIDGHYNRKKKK